MTNYISLSLSLFLQIPRSYKTGDRVIDITQNTTREYQNDHWVDLECLYLPQGEKGEKGDTVPSNDIVNALIGSDAFLALVKGAKGER